MEHGAECLLQSGTGAREKRLYILICLGSTHLTSPKFLSHTVGQGCTLVTKLWLTYRRRNSGVNLRTGVSPTIYHIVRVSFALCVQTFMRGGEVGTQGVRVTPGPVPSTRQSGEGNNFLLFQNHSCDPPPTFSFFWLHYWSTNLLDVLL